MGWAPAVFGRFLKPGGLGGRPKLELAFPTMPLVREKARSSSSNFWLDESCGWLLRGRVSKRFRSAYNYAFSLVRLQRFEEAKALIHKWMPVARRVLGESNELTLKMRKMLAIALLADADVREAVTTLEDAGRTARRVLGGAHPLTKNIEGTLRKARAALHAREASTGSA